MFIETGPTNVGENITEKWGFVSIWKVRGLMEINGRKIAIKPIYFSNKNRSLPFWQFWSTALKMSPSCCWPVTLVQVKLYYIYV